MNTASTELNLFSGGLAATMPASAIRFPNEGAAAARALPTPLPTPPKPTAPKTPEFVTELEREAAEAIAAFDAAAAFLPAALKPLSDNNSYTEFRKPLQKLQDGLSDRNDFLRSVWRINVDRLCRAAEAQFRPPSGVPLTISSAELVMDIQADTTTAYEANRRGTSLTFPPLAEIWAHLRKHHGTQEAAESIDEAVLKDFMRKFLLTWGPGTTRRVLKEPKWRGSRLVLEMSVYSERTSGGNWEYSFTARENLTRDMNLLANVMRIVGAAELAMAFDSLRGFGEFKHVIESRARYALPQDSAYVTYQKKIEFEIGKDVSVELMARMGEIARKYPPE